MWHIARQCKAYIRKYFYYNNIYHRRQIKVDLTGQQLYNNCVVRYKECVVTKCAYIRT